jgi:hypothetical protein
MCIFGTVIKLSKSLALLIYILLSQTSLLSSSTFALCLTDLLSNFSPGSATMTKVFFFFFFFGCAQSLEVNTGILPHKIMHVYSQPPPMHFFIL